MTKNVLFTADPELDQLHGFTRSLAEIQWLTLVLVLLYLQVPGRIVQDDALLVAAMVLFGGFVLVFNYTNFFRTDRTWKLAVETWVMILFITVVVWQTGSTDSVLLNLYLLVIIASALTLGKLMTLLEVGLIAACYVLLGYYGNSDVFSLTYAGSIMAELSPFLLVGYLTTMLASDIHFANKKIRALAGTDELTGLLNMRGFMSILQREHDLAARYARQYNLILLDVDNMKLINDVYGHEAGNRTLKAVASVLRANTRSTDAVARFGGDEFVLLLVETDEKRAAEVVKRIQKSIGDTPLALHGELVQLQASIGCTNYPRNGTEYAQLLEDADAAMYREKRRKHKQAIGGMPSADNAALTE